MPSYTDDSQQETAAAETACDWLVIDHGTDLLGAGPLVSLSTPRHPGGLPGFMVTFTRAALPQLRRVLELLEKDQPSS
jgi:hypothetical protein